MGSIGSNIFIKNSRPLKTSNNTNLELDFYNPILGIAFEVQDFSTHSIIHDDEPLFAGLDKKGPRYHRMKKLLAREQLDIELFDLWEDEITLGYSHNILMSVINNHMKK